jgi:antitoxin ParD1/3/4
MNVNLTPQLEELVRSKVASGLYTSASEVVCEALRLMEEQVRLREAKLAQLRSDVGQGLASGSSQPWDAEAFKSKARARRTNGIDVVRVLHGARYRCDVQSGALTRLRHDPG